MPTADRSSPAGREEVGRVLRDLIDAGYFAGRTEDVRALPAALEAAEAALACTASTAPAVAPDLRPGLEEALAEALHATDPRTPEDCPWAEWVAYCARSPTLQRAVDDVRARAAEILTYLADVPGGGAAPAPEAE